MSEDSQFTNKTGSEFSFFLINHSVGLFRTSTFDLEIHYMWF